LAYLAAKLPNIEEIPKKYLRSVPKYQTTADGDITVSMEYEGIPRLFLYYF
jgi:hypothetical protein